MNLPRCAVIVESGKHADRPQLAAALAACKKQKAKLVIAKLDRLSRNLAFIATLMDSGVEFIAVDNPHANKLTIHILAAVAQHEREMIAQRTREALAAAKAENGRPRMIMLEGPMDIASVFEWFAEESKSIAEQAIEPAQREKFAKLASLWANAMAESISATSLPRHDSAESIGAILADSGNHLAGGGLGRAP